MNDRKPIEILLRNGVTFLTYDKNMVGGLLTKTDEELLNPPIGPILKDSCDTVNPLDNSLIPLTPESFNQIGEAGVKLVDYLNNYVQPRMNKGRALFVKKIRVEDRYSWRAVALRCWTEWGGNWSPPDNQIAGLMICEFASKVLKETVD